jgi:cell division septation protein DedD
MAAENEPDERTRELRLEGRGLAVSLVGLGALVLAAVAGAFLLGRWVERRALPVGGGSSAGPGPLEQVLETESAARTEPTYFDHLGGSEKQLEPGRELPEAPRAATPAAAGAGAPGPFFVQVFAGRDRSSAEELVSRLERGGHAVRVVGERDGNDSLFKVRVGGFPSEDQARQTMERLRQTGFPSAWVVRDE